MARMTGPLTALLLVLTGCSPIVGRWTFERTEPGTLPKDVESGHLEFRWNGEFEYELKRAGEPAAHQHSGRYQFWDAPGTDGVIRIEWTSLTPGGPATLRRFGIVQFLDHDRYVRAEGRFFIPSDTDDWKIVFRRE